jgi:hypothetical protein
MARETPPMTAEAPPKRRRSAAEAPPIRFIITEN